MKGVGSSIMRKKFRFIVSPHGDVRNFYGNAFGMNRLRFEKGKEPVVPVLRALHKLRCFTISR